MKLANDPSQSEQARQHCRALMEEHLHLQLRSAFQLARRSAAGKI